MSNTPLAEIVLIVGSDHSYCGRCGENADTRDVAHVRVPESSAAGCGAVFTSIRSDRPFPSEALARVVAGMRPDLMAI